MNKEIVYCYIEVKYVLKIDIIYIISIFNYIYI